MKQLFITVLILLTGCAQTDKIKIPKDNPYRPMAYTAKEIDIDSVVSNDDQLTNIPDKEINLSLIKTVTLQQLFEILNDNGVNIISNIQSERLVTLPYFKGDVKEFLSSLQKSHGLFYQVHGKTVIITEKQPVYITVMFPGIHEHLIETLKAIGIENPYYDVSSSKIAFVTDFKTYSKVKSYFLKNGLVTLCYMDITVIENAIAENESFGIDWKQLALSVSQTVGSTEAVLKSLAAGGYQLTFADDKFRFSTLFHSLSDKANLKVLQNARLSTVNGKLCILDVSEKIPYIEEITVGSLNQNSNNAVQGFKFSEVDSGIVLKLKPIVLNDLVSLEIESTIQTVIEFINVGNEDVQIKRPVTTVRNLKTDVAIKAGETALVGGLRYKRTVQSNEGLYRAMKFGKRDVTLKTFDISILVRPTIVHYNLIERR